MHRIESSLSGIILHIRRRRRRCNWPVCMWDKPSKCVEFLPLSNVQLTEPKAYMRYSDWHFSVVHCRHCRCRRCLERFTFSSPDPQANITWHKASFVKGDSNLFKWRYWRFAKGRNYLKMRKHIDEIWKSSPPEPVGQFQPNFAQISRGWKGFKYSSLFKCKETRPFPKGS